MSHEQSRFIGRKALADTMGISKYTILRWTKLKGFPEPLLNSGRTPIYDLQEIENWLRGISTTTSEKLHQGVNHE
jgi:predicted DNA-binding transcriptional regulator AlpA